VRVDRLAALGERIDKLKERLALERGRLAELEHEIVSLEQRIAAAAGLPETAAAEQLRQIGEQVSRLEGAHRRRIEDELQDFRDRELLPRLTAEERRTGIERRSGMDRRRE
jgi:hypothetical protein